MFEGTAETLEMLRSRGAFLPVSTSERYFMGKAEEGFSIDRIIYGTMDHLQANEWSL